MLLTESQILTKLDALRGWEYKDACITKVYGFSEYMKAVDFVNKLALLAEDMNHHPDILLRYNQVVVTITTHDARGVTEKDVLLAKEIEKMAAVVL